MPRYCFKLIKKYLAAEFYYKYAAPALICCAKENLLTTKHFRILIIVCFLMGLLSSLDVFFPELIPAELRAAENKVGEHREFFVLTFYVGALAFVLLSQLAALIGLYLFKKWARTTAEAAILATFVLTAILGPELSSGLAAAIGQAECVLWGGILAVSRYSGLNSKFV